MKKRNFIYVSALCALMSFSFTSCGDDEDPIPEIPEQPDHEKPEPEQPVVDESFMALYFLNSGKMGSNNASLYMYDVDKEEVVPDYFLAQNGRGLGDTAQDIVVYGDKMYITVSGENTIEVTDLHAKSIKQIKVDQQPRYLAMDGGKVYISYFNGEVARLDTASLEVDATVKVGRNPEQMAVANGKLFVANSGGMDYNTEVGYDKTVSVVDLASFTETTKVEVVLNPTRIVADEQGAVYVISMGDYMAVPNTLQKIDAETLEVSVVEGCPSADRDGLQGGDPLFLLFPIRRGLEHDDLLRYL